MRQALSVTLAVLLVVGAIVPFVSMTAVASSVTTIDADHGLATDESKSAFESSGKASANVPFPQMELQFVTTTAKTDHISGHTMDSYSSDYLVIDYREDIERTIRLYVPSEYAKPYTKENVEGLNGHTADYERIQDGEYTKVTIKFDESGTAVLPFNQYRGFAHSNFEKTKRKVTGIIPGNSDSDEEQWSYPQEDTLNGSDAEFEISGLTDGEYVAQYDTNGELEGGWKTIPTSESHPAPVYIHKKDDVESSVWVISETKDAPAIRYKKQKSATDTMTGIGSGIKDIASSIKKDLDGLLNFGDW